MASVVPTVLAATPEDYQAMLERAQGLSRRVHVDICDGRFADTRTINAAQVHAGAQVQLDLHLMVQEPAAILETALSLQPHVIIFHAESEGNLTEMMQYVRGLGVRSGLALLPPTSVEAATELIATADHVLIFSGHLGHNGGEFQADQLSKVPQIRALKPDVEISVDGGVNDRNAAEITAAGVDVLYVGGFIQQAHDPKGAYESVVRQVEVAA